MKILIVGYGPVNSKLMELLPPWGYQVFVTGSGAEALDVMQGDSGPMLLVINWILPDMSGVDLCSKLKKDHRQELLYVLLLTEASHKGESFAGSNRDVDDYVGLPIQPDEMRARLALGRRILDFQHSLDTMSRQLEEKDVELNRFALRDPLTGVASEKYFKDRLAEELRRVGRLGQPMSLIIFDIDYFKAYNDTYGQSAGDECLRTLAQIITSSVSRGGDFIARHGGGFAVLLPNTDSLGALVIAEAIRVAVSIQKIEHIPAGIDGHVTISAGTMTATPNRTMRADRVVAKAMQVLYAAKAAGRNSVKQLAEKHL